MGSTEPQEKRTDKRKMEHGPSEIRDVYCMRAKKRKLLAKSQGLSSCYSTVQVRALERIREHLSSLRVKPTQRARRREHLGTLSIRSEHTPPGHVARPLAKPPAGGLNPDW